MGRTGRRPRGERALLARILVGRALGTSFPWGTLAINVACSLLLGLAYRLFTAKFHGKYADTLRLLLGTGFLGAYTTFSTFSYETLMLAEHGNWQKAAAYVAASVLLGLIGAWLGMRIALAL